jgi:hypothetical protein
VAVRGRATPVATEEVAPFTRVRWRPRGGVAEGGGGGERRHRGGGRRQAWSLGGACGRLGRGAGGWGWNWKMGEVRRR